MVLTLFAACSSDLQKAQSALDSYTLEQANKMVASDFTLPKTLGGYTVTWICNNTEVLKIVDGGENYTVQYIGAIDDTEVTLTAVIATDSGEARRGFRINVASNIPRANNDEYLDTYTSEFKATWTDDYIGKNFWNTGIGQVVVDTNGHVDGDTTRFKLTLGATTLTVRYYAIDTPESTGAVEPWGVQASNFTKTTLNAASEIVLQATAETPTKDRYGSRYLAYVWYRNSADEDFRCLNLELVENGYANYTGSNTEGYPYHDVFSKAAAYAKAFQLRVHSKLKDPLYNDDPVKMEIKNFLDNPYQFYNEETNVGSKVEFVAYLTELYKTNTHTFLATQYDPETGEEYSVNVYTAYDSTRASRDFRIGHLYKIVGNVQYYNKKTWQITDINYMDVDFDGKTITVERQKNYYLTFDQNFDSHHTWSNQWSEGLYGDLTVKSVGDVTDGKLTFTAEAYKRLNQSTYATTATLFTLTVTVPSNYSGAIKVGSSLALCGLQLEAGSGNITILNYKNITIR